MKALAVLFVALLGCASPRTVLEPKAGSPVAQAVKHSVYLKESGCTGVNVGGGKMVTAKHCVPDDAVAGDAYEGGRLVHISPSYDFVVVQTTDLLYSRPRISMHRAHAGEHIYVVGFPVQLGSNEQELTITDGLVAGPVNADGEARITAPVYFGNSGGGVWSDSGELVGIAVSIYAAQLGGRPIPYVGQAFMVPVSLITPHL